MKLSPLVFLLMSVFAFGTALPIAQDQNLAQVQLHDLTDVKTMSGRNLDMDGAAEEIADELEEGAGEGEEQSEEEQQLHSKMEEANEEEEEEEDQQLEPKMEEANEEEENEKDQLDLEKSVKLEEKRAEEEEDDEEEDEPEAGDVELVEKSEDGVELVEKAGEEEKAGLEKVNMDHGAIGRVALMSSVLTVSAFLVILLVGAAIFIATRPKDKAKSQASSATEVVHQAGQDSARFHVDELTDTPRVESYRKSSRRQVSSSSSSNYSSECQRPFLNYGRYAQLKSVPRR